jgi:mono/diheme cytochrome c family protein
MKKLRRALLLICTSILLLLILGINFTIGWRPFLGSKKRVTTDRQFESTPERVVRGRYLAQSVLGCATCHTPRDFTKHGAPSVAGVDFAGQPMELGGFPGHIVVPNITPDKETGAGNWTDDQIARAIREGIKHDDTTLFPLMPYMLYKNLSDEDLALVLVYLRSIPPLRNPLPASKVNFPVNYLVRGVPQPVTKAVRGPDPSNTVARGKYLVVMGCGCHDAKKNFYFAGGENLRGPWGDMTSPNITPDASGIGYYSESTFITAMRTGYVGARELNQIMPYGEFKDITDDDLKAMFAYLKTLAPVKHRVDNSLPPTYCKLCKEQHGAGSQN